MNSRERVETALNHETSDRLPLDLGGSMTTGMHCTIVYQLRQALGLDKPGTPVKVFEPYQMLGQIDPDLQEALGVDAVPMFGPKTMFGFRREGWKEWEFHDGTPLLVPEGFNIDPEPDGQLLMYPEGDKSVAPSGRMPQNGWYFDAIIRQEPIDDDALNPEDNLAEFELISDEDLAFFKERTDFLYEQTDKAIVADFGGTGFGDIAMVPAAWVKETPKGIRDVEEWYMSTVLRPDYVYEVFSKQAEIALHNLAKLYEVVGDRVTAVFLTGTDFGMQTCLLVSPNVYRTLFKPFHAKLNDWVHENTSWKTFIHSCGSVVDIIPDFIEAGFDVLNPVQCSATGMEPQGLKDRFGDNITFWGGGVDTQKTLPTGTPDEVREEVKERIRIFGAGGGYVFNTIHNVQPQTPIENVLAMYETVQKYRDY
ncbi:MAG: hypothetical protein KC445_00845 [Anaerolineales bacterium]|nr:hypothetical protein [Anaerolineales bacterium]